MKNAPHRLLITMTIIAFTTLLLADFSLADKKLMSIVGGITTACLTIAFII